MVAVRARVYGRVQGVGFRYDAQMTAHSLGLTGWVRNRMDGSVEVHAEGAAADVRQFEAYLHQGPPTAHVDRVEVSHREPTGKYERFSVAF